MCMQTNLEISGDSGGFRASLDKMTVHNDTANGPVNPNGISVFLSFLRPPRSNWASLNVWERTEARKQRKQQRANCTFIVTTPFNRTRH